MQRGEARTGQEKGTSGVTTATAGSEPSAIEVPHTLKACRNTQTYTHSSHTSTAANEHHEFPTWCACLPPQPQLLPPRIFNRNLSETRARLAATCSRIRTVYKLFPSPHVHHIFAGHKATPFNTTLTTSNDGTLTKRLLDRLSTSTTTTTAATTTHQAHRRALDRGPDADERHLSRHPVPQPQGGDPPSDAAAHAHATFRQNLAGPVPPGLFLLPGPAPVAVAVVAIVAAEAQHQAAILGARRGGSAEPTGGASVRPVERGLGTAANLFLYRLVVVCRILLRGF